MMKKILETFMLDKNDIIPILILSIGILGFYTSSDFNNNIYSVEFNNTVDSYKIFYDNFKK